MTILVQALKRLFKASVFLWNSSKVRFRYNRLPAVHNKYGPHYRAAIKTIIDASNSKGARRSYVIGSVMGALQAKNCGYDKICLAEFGVAAGGGFRALLSVAQAIRVNFGMEVSVVGFDNRDGLPQPKGYRDHPEIWSETQFAMSGSYPMLNEEAEALGGKLIIGDVADTLPEYDLEGSRLAFASVDVDYYSSTKPIVGWFSSIKTKGLLPATVIYFDDVLNNWTYSSHAGEGLAICEFNRQNEFRKLELKQRVLKLYALHDFEHPMRTGDEKPEVPLELFVESLNSYFIQKG